MGEDFRNEFPGDGVAVRPVDGCAAPQRVRQGFRGLLVLASKIQLPEFLRNFFHDFREPCQKVVGEYGVILNNQSMFASGVPGIFQHLNVAG